MNRKKKENIKRKLLGVNILLMNELDGECPEYVKLIIKFESEEHL